MIYCEKKNTYVDQEELCDGCSLYNKEKNGCNYPDWNPGLKKGKENND